MNRKFIIFRFEKSKKGGDRKMYFTPALSWSAIDTMAMKADYETMRKFAKKFKDQHPDLIIESQTSSIFHLIPFEDVETTPDRPEPEKKRKPRGGKRAKV